MDHFTGKRKSSLLPPSLLLHTIGRCVLHPCQAIGMNHTTTDARFRLRVQRNNRIAIGPGKVSLLEAIAETGSISAAARRHGMSYRRAWLLVNEMNQALREPAVATATGGASGGGARLTEVGQEIVRRYRRVETVAYEAGAADLAALQDLLTP